MDGNTTINEEEEFIDALKDEMPEVFKNIEANFEQIQKIKDMLDEVKESQSIERMTEAKKELDDATTKVEQCESLVNKLENEIIEWNAHKKLVRRDEELQEIEGLTDEFKEEIGGEMASMQNHMKKQDDKLEKNPDDKDALALKEGLGNYLNDLNGLLTEVNDLRGEKDQCFDEFDADIPSPVKEERKKRWAGHPKLKKKPVNTDSDKPADMYYQISVNCKYRQRIHDMLKALRMIN